MKPSPQWWYYAAVALLFILLKLGYTRADSADLLPLLRPTNFLVELVVGSPGVFHPAEGYVHAALGFSIDKSCSGFNFWLMCWLLLVVAYEPYRRPRRWLVPVLLPLLSYSLTILANTSRISTAVLLSGALPSAVRRLAWLHEAEGAAVYALCLVGIYFVFLFVCSQTTSRRAHAA